MGSPSLRGFALLVAAVAWLAGCAQAPDAQPVPRRHFVFFENDSAALTPTAEQTVRTVAAEIASSRPRVVQVTGYAGAGGPAKAAQALSERRAMAVGDALVAAGVPRDRLRVAAKGEDEAISRSAVVDRQVEIEFLD